MNDLVKSFSQNFIEKNRYQYILDGLVNTLIMTACAVIIGIIIGFIIAIIRSNHDKTGRLKVLNFICNLYLTVIRGTPMVLQLLITYFVIFASVNVSKMLVAIIAFGINSGAYVAEIIRGGIMSIDNGQFEAGRSLGFSYHQTMVYFILPQALKNVLPALGNEFVVLLKETSVAGYIAMQDLTKGADIIRSQTYSAFMPLVMAALIYLALVMLFDGLIKKLERRLRNSDH
ncbi:MAG: amino acid ABC transporter permease [Lachnospiraceae bacterium]|nr:amino acid ABC transporter permease [Lachnospiraceae bacterium]